MLIDNSEDKTRVKCCSSCSLAQVEGKKVYCPLTGRTYSYGEKCSCSDKLSGLKKL